MQFVNRKVGTSITLDRLKYITDVPYYTKKIYIKMQIIVSCETHISELHAHRQTQRRMRKALSSAVLV
jgi:ribosomal protein S26